MLIRAAGGMFRLQWPPKGVKVRASTVGCCQRSPAAEAAPLSSKLRSEVRLAMPGSRWKSPAARQRQRKGGVGAFHV
jgi:hypothetical protein